jgi:hypothetical protein
VDGSNAGNVSQQRGSNDSQERQEEGVDSNASSNAGSNAHIHGILLNRANSRAASRSPLHGVSPSNSMKSVRFSFEGLDHAVAGVPEADQEQLGDQKGGRRSGGGSARHSVSPPTGRGRSGSEWLRHTLYEQLASHSPTALGTSPKDASGSAQGGFHHAEPHNSSSSGAGGGGGSGYNHHRAYESQGPRRHYRDGGGSSSGGSRHGHQGLAASSHPPAHARHGAHYLGRFAEGRQRNSSVQEFVRQQQRQVRQQQVAKEVAAMAAAVKDRVQPKAPVHPIFGVMHAAGAAGGGGGSSAP